MHRILVTAGVTALLAVGALAQSDSDYQALMKKNGATMQAVNKAIAAKDGSAVAASGKTFQETFKQVGDFWQKRNADDAVGFAKKAQAAAEGISKAGEAGDMDKAAAEVKNLQATCGGCHMAHREKVGDNFQIK